ncbi:MAG: thiamine phosphate synthase [Chloroflexota bacterium]|nr:thiamine phosphate synthase [Chloroflexota bacterium]MDE2931954.1 thiamine phosphate synthase [Chloroflexota bacterium]
MSTKRALDLRLYVVLDPAIAGGRSVVEIARQTIAGGVTMLQLRDKRSPDRNILDAATAIAQLCRAASIPFIVNDRVDIAWASGADGVHLGHDDLPPAAARRLLGDDAIIGMSAGNLTELAAALPALPDYLGVGPMYATHTKRDAGAPVGPAMIRTLREAAPTIPLVGIGGITAENAAAVLAAGAAGIAVVSAVVAARDVEAATRALRCL